MKKIALLFLLLPLFAISQISGKYEADQFVAVPAVSTVTAGSLTVTTSYDIEISGNDYTWQITSSWGATSTLTTSTVGIQYSPDGVTWVNYASPSTMTTTTPIYQVRDVSVPSKWLRLKYTVTSGDNLYNPKAWYEFKRK